MLFSKVIIIAFAHKKKFLKKLKRKQFQNWYQLRNLYPFQYQNQQISHEVNQSQEELSIGEQSILLDVLWNMPFVSIFWDISTDTLN